MPRDLIAEIDSILEQSCQKLKQSVQRRGLLRTPLDTQQAELEIHALCREMADEVTASLLVASVEDRQEQAQSGPAPAVRGRAKTRAVGRRHTTVRLLGGKVVPIKTSYRLPVRTPRRGRKPAVGKRGKAGTGYFPHLVVLGILCGATPAVLSEVGRQAAESSSLEVAQRSLARRGLALNIKTITNLTQALGRLSLHLRQAQMLSQTVGASAPGALSGKRVVAAVDGGRMRVRYSIQRGRRRKSGRRGFEAPWREPKVLIVYVIDDNGKKERHTLSLYDATLGDANAVFALLVGYLRMMGAQDAAQLVLTGDGARWIWDRVEELVKAVGLDPERFVAVVDYFHAVEHLRDVADLMKSWSAKRRRQFVRFYKQVLRKGEVEEVIAAIDELCIGRNATDLAVERDYFAKNADRMRYADFERRGLPIGSGAVESAVRQVVNQRLKSNGMFWLETRAEHMLHLRAFLRAGRWDELVGAVLVHHCSSEAEALA
jgi:hypothetical protein